MHIDYRKHIRDTMIVTTIAVILCGAIGYITGALLKGFVAGAVIGSLYLIIGFGLSRYYLWKWRKQSRMSVAVVNEAVGALSKKLSETMGDAMKSASREDTASTIEDDIALRQRELDEIADTLNKEHQSESQK